MRLPPTCVNAGPPAPLTLTDVSPDSIPTDENIVVTLIGTGFDQTSAVHVEPTMYGTAELVSDTELRVTINKTFADDDAVVYVRNLFPFRRSNELAMAFIPPVPPPVLTSVTPNPAVIATDPGNASLVLAGTGFNQHPHTDPVVYLRDPVNGTETSLGMDPNSMTDTFMEAFFYGSPGTYGIVLKDGWRRYSNEVSLTVTL